MGKQVLIWSIAVAAILGICFLLASMTTIDPGHEGVIITFGKVDYDRTLKPGFHIVPFWKDVEVWDVHVAKEEIKVLAFSQDLQEAQVTVALNYRPAISQTNRLHNEYGRDYKGRVIIPAFNKAVKAGTAKHTAEGIIANRQAVTMSILEYLEPVLAEGYVDVVDLSLVDIDFKQAFKDAVEAKQIMAQMALEEKNKRDREKWIAEQAIEKARGEAARLKQKADAIMENPAILTLKAIEAWQAGGSQVPQILILGGDEAGQLIGSYKSALLPLEQKRTKGEQK